MIFADRVHPKASIAREKALPGRRLSKDFLLSWAVDASAAEEKKGQRMTLSGPMGLFTTPATPYFMLGAAKASANASPFGTPTPVTLSQPFLV